MRRRHFLRALAAAGVTLPSLPGLSGTGTVRAATAGDGRGRASDTGGAGRPRHLVLVELQGGNDGLNTLAPVGDARYRALRPTLALSRDETLMLDERLGLHPALEPLMDLWARGELALVQGVGYPSPNRSHFRSIEIWETASAADETRVDGWLLPLTAALPPRASHGVKALAIGSDEGPLAGSLDETVVFENLRSFLRQARGLDAPDASAAPVGSALAHVLEIERTTHEAARAFAERLGETIETPPASGSPLARRLALVARLIEADLGPQVFKVELGGFDTHAGQVKRHRALLGQLGEAVAAFAARLRASGHWDETLLMSYSEFGRRVAENGTGGTDHGTAAPQLVVGGRVAGGLHGRHPDLGRLERGDPEFTTDFRSLYATVAREWFGRSLAEAPFAEFDTLPLLRGG